MGDMLSQAEIDALLGGAGSSDSAPEPVVAAPEPQFSAPSGTGVKTELTDEQKDILGEIGNISMGTAATTLFQLLNQKVWITTPYVKEIIIDDLRNMYDRPCVGIRVDYKEGLIGSNVLILKERDVKIIANLMMGGDGTGDEVDGELTELDLSAIGEAMNQMVGSSSTSLSSMTKMKIDINTPQAFLLKFDDQDFLAHMGIDMADQEVVAIQFKMEVGNLIDSQIMQMIPTKFAVQMVDTLKNEFAYSAPAEVSAPPPAPAPPAPPPAPEMSYQPPPEMAYQPPMPPMPPMPDMGYQQQPMPMQQPTQQPGMAYQTPQYAPPPGMQEGMQQPYGYGAPQYGMPQGYGYAPPPQQPQYSAPPPQQNVNVQQAQFQSFDYAGIMQQKENIGIIMDVPLEVNVELGRTTKLIREILEFGPGTVIELDKLAGEPVDIFVNGKHVAKGEVVVIDENFGIRITDIVSVENRI